jgi:hypothetical protein
MKYRFTIILIVLNALLFFLLMKQQSPFDLRDSGLSGAEALLPRPMSEVSSITLFNRGNPLYSLTMKDGDWVLSHPIEWQANAFAVRRMLSRLAITDASIRFPVEDIQARNQQLSDFGLEDPEFTVRIGYESETYDFALGSPVEIGDRLYALSPGADEVIVVDTGILRPFLIELDELRSRKLMPIPPFEATSLLVEFTDEGVRQRFTRSDTDWVIDSPFYARGNIERMMAALDRLVDMEVHAINGPAVLSEGIQPPNVIARIEMVGNRRNSTLLITHHWDNGVISPDFFRGRIEGTQTRFLIPAEAVRWWRSAATRIRERRLFAFEPTAITRLEVDRRRVGGSHVRILRLEDQSWKLYGGEGSLAQVELVVDDAVIATTWEQLRDIVALEFINEAPSSQDIAQAGLTDNPLRILIEGKETLVLKIGNPIPSDPNLLLAQMESSPGIFLVSKEAIDRIRSNPIHYRNREVPVVPSGSHARFFRIEDRLTGATIDNLSAESLSAMVSGSLDVEDAEAKSATMIALIDRFRVHSFEASTYSPEGILVDGERVPWRFRMSWHRDHESIEPVGTMELTPRLGGDLQYVYIENARQVARLDPSWIDLLHPLLFNPETPQEHQLPAPQESLPQTTPQENDPIPDASTITD